METSLIMHFLMLSLLWFGLVRIEASASNHNKVSALYVFGDSTVDPGNNNYLKTGLKSDFLPYGRDFPNHVPTGRFTNGKLVTDFFASYFGLKELVPAYLDPNLSDDELITGVSFASAGSGFDPLTPTLTNVIPIPKQLEYFKEYKRRLEGKLGKERTEQHMKSAVFFISAGTNDFVVNYYTVPIRRKSYSISAYSQFVLQHLQYFIQELWGEGARKIAVVGLPPMGCLPIMITFNSNNAMLKRGCIDKFSAVARDYNSILQHQLLSIQSNFSNNNNNSGAAAKLVYIDIYGPLSNMVTQPHQFGFEEVDSGCCGSGYVEMAYLCNKASYVCSDASKYLFWDSIHPSQKAYQDVFMLLRHTLDALVKD